jgi:hypothetical protein
VNNLENEKVFSLLQEWKKTDKPVEDIYQEIAVAVPTLSEEEIIVALEEDPIENNWG